MIPQPANSNRGAGLGRSDAIDAEIARFQGRLKADPASLAFLPLAEALRKAGKLDEAKAVCLQGLGHHTDYISGQVVLARILTDMGDREAAREVLERVVEATPDHLLGNKLLAQNYLLSGLKEKARARLGTVVMLNPADEEAAVALASLERERQAAPPAPPAPAPPLLVEPTRREVPPGPGASAAPIVSAEPMPSPGPLADIAPVPPPPPENEEFSPTDWSQAAAMDAGDIEEIIVEGEEDAPEGPFLEFGGISGIDDVEEIVDSISDAEEIEEKPFPEGSEPAERAEAPNAAPVESVLTLPGLSEEAPDHPMGEITSETLADLYFAQDLPDKAIRIYRELLVEEPGNEKVAQKLARALASVRAAAGPSFAEPRTPVVQPAATPVPPTSAAGRETAGVLIDRLEEWLTTIGERRRGIH
jgi:tetratricopeptide (TPR) repeat protein